MFRVGTVGEWQLENGLCLIYVPFWLLMGGTNENQFGRRTVHLMELATAWIYVEVGMF
jgi:hypothetical protein